jgi:hypothetical protein
MREFLSVWQHQKKQKKSSKTYVQGGLRMARVWRHRARGLYGESDGFVKVHFTHGSINLSTKSLPKLISFCMEGELHRSRMLPRHIGYTSAGERRFSHRYW